MKQYTTPEQTAKLIELGVEKPKNERWVLDVANESTPSIQNIVKRLDYSIGELIEMLPERIEGEYNDSLLAIEKARSAWWVMYLYLGKQKYAKHCEELVDALYDMITMLKNEGVI